jgi:hypothetical protein
MHMHAYVHTDINACTYMYKYIPTYSHTEIYVHIYTYTYIYSFIQHISISAYMNIYTELLGFRTLSIVWILIITRKKNKHDVLETGSVSVLR